MNGKRMYPDDLRAEAKRIMDMADEAPIGSEMNIALAQMATTLACTAEIAEALRGINSNLGVLCENV